MLSIDFTNDLGLALSTFNVESQRDQFIRNVQCFSAHAKEAKTAHYVKLEDALLTWFREVTVAGGNVDGQLLLNNSSGMAVAFGVDDLQAPRG